MFSKYVLFKKGHLNKRAGVWTPPGHSLLDPPLPLQPVTVPSRGRGGGEWAVDPGILEYLYYYFIIFYK